MKTIRILTGLLGTIMAVTGAAADSVALESAIRGSIKDLRVLSPEWICVVVDPTEEILAARQERYGAELEAEKAKFESGQIPRWYWPFSKQFRMLNIQQSYHQPLFASFNQPGFWTVNGKRPVEVTVWPHSIDGFPNWTADDAPSADCGSYSRTADMVYLRLHQPLRSGDSLEVRATDGRSDSLTFDDRRTPSWTLKVNQASYDAASGSKRAYLGLWLPGIGPLDLDAFEGKPFHLYAYQGGSRWDEGSAVGEPLFTGEIKMRLRFADQAITREGGSNATGEDVYELDFSSFNREGLFCLQVPGLGRSWPFRISRSGYADAFFTMMKGLYIQRCGCALTEPFTAWTRPLCHADTHQGGFIPETEGWYRQAYRKDNTNFGFRAATGKQVALSTFTLIGNEKPDAPILPGVKGGWHDAADFDRRIHHYTVVHDLLALFEFFPGRFKDGQLNLPESANGIPDLLDEASVGVEVWRRTQRADGAVSSWIEQESHPGQVANDMQAAFATNQMAMFASTPDRAGTFAYAITAAWLGRLLLPYDQERGNAYIQSARKAYLWARSPEHTLRDRTFLIEKPMRNADLKGQTIRFDEDPKLLAQDRAYAARGFAAAFLYIATHDEAYRKELADQEFGKTYPTIAWANNPVLCLPLLTQPVLTDDEQAAMRRTIIESADKLVESQQGYAYRTLWLAPSDGWVHSLAWGNLHGKTRQVVAAHVLTGEPKYRTALEDAANFFLGCNPMGQTMVTGIGSVYPVVIQHIHSLSDGIVEPTPGIAPYTFTFGFSTRPFLILDGGHPSVKAYFDSVAAAFIPDRLGRAEIQEGLDRCERTGNWMQVAAKPGRDILWKNFPVFRRKVTHPGSAVDQNEFTVNETISPLALLFGSLTADEWSVPEEISHRKPRTSLLDVPYYSMP